ncbi:hypothetical protein PMAYCL1PPCAC_10452, partial [Pristionchus mayeri]
AHMSFSSFLPSFFFSSPSLSIDQPRRELSAIVLSLSDFLIIPIHIHEYRRLVQKETSQPPLEFCTDRPAIDTMIPPLPPPEPHPKLYRK